MFLRIRWIFLLMNNSMLLLGKYVLPVRFWFWCIDMIFFLLWTALFILRWRYPLKEIWERNGRKLFKSYCFASTEDQKMLEAADTSILLRCSLLRYYWPLQLHKLIRLILLLVMNSKGCRRSCNFTKKYCWYNGRGFFDLRILTIF